MNRLSWCKGHIARMIESCGNNVRASSYQLNSDRLCTIQHPIQHLVPLEIRNEIQEIGQTDEENQNEFAKEECLRRAAVLNSNILRKIRCKPN